MHAKCSRTCIYIYTCKYGDIVGGRLISFNNIPINIHGIGYQGIWNVRIPVSGPGSRELRVLSAGFSDARVTGAGPSRGGRAGDKERGNKTCCSGSLGMKWRGKPSKSMICGFLSYVFLLYHIRYLLLIRDFFWDNHSLEARYIWYT